MTFLEGFAQGFNDSYNRRKDREAEKENTMFKYQMEGLLKNKELRQKKKLEETQWMNQAKDLSGQLGDTEASTMFYKELANGVSYETLQKRLLEGQYEKNLDYKAPTQTVKIPSGVSTASTLTEKTPEVVEASGGGLKGILERGKARNESAMQDRVNKQIDELDPELRQYSQMEDEETPTMDYSNSPYKLKNNEMKIGDYADSLYKLRMAQQKGDPEAIRKAQTEVEVHQTVMAEKAMADAKAQGKNVGQYFMVGQDGTIEGIIAGETRVNQETGRTEVWNISDPRQEQTVQGELRQITDDKMMGRYTSLVTDFGKKSKEYNDASASFITAVDSSNKIVELLNKNPGVAAGGVASGVALLGRLEGEAKTAYAVLYDLEQEIKTQVQEGNMEGIEAKVAKYVEEANSFAQKSFMTEGMQNLAVDKAKYDSLRIAVAYQFAVASGVSNGRMSNQDFENNYERIGGNKPANQVIDALKLTGQESFVRLDSVRNSLANDPSIKTFERDYRLKTGLAPKRIGDQLAEMGRADLMPYIGALNSQNEVGKRVAAETANPAPDQNVPVQIQNVEDYNNLPKGAVYIDPNGKKKVKR